jgi:hypothetical protein
MSDPDSSVHEGGCLCGAIRFRATAPPVRTTICHCTFCQRLTGSAFLVEPIFKAEDVASTGAPPKTYERRSEGSGKRVRVSFCGCCGVSLFLAFERFPGVVGVFGGAFDDPNWFDRGLGACRHIFTRHAQKGVAVPPDVQVHEDHALELDGRPNVSRIFPVATVLRPGACGG